MSITHLHHQKEHRHFRSLVLQPASSSACPAPTPEDSEADEGAAPSKGLGQAAAQQRANDGPDKQRDHKKARGCSALLRRENFSDNGTADGQEGGHC